MALFTPQTTRSRLADPANTGAADVFQPTGAPTFGDDTTPSPTFQPPRLPKFAEPSAPSPYLYGSDPSQWPSFTYHPTNESDPSGSDPGPPTGSGQPGQPTPYPAEGGTTNRRGAVAQFYRTALGREGSQQEIDAWASGGMDLSAIQQAIYASDEAKAYSTRQTNGATTPTGGGSLDWTNPATWTQQNINAYAASRGVTDPNFANYWLSKKDELFQRGKELGNPNYAFMRLSMADDFGGPRYGGGGGTGVFDDPATKEWEQALRAVVDRLNNPYNNPALLEAMDYFKKYATRLQGPAFSPQEMDILQTQALDPLTSQRDAMRQQILQRASQRGLNPDSGIVQDEINQLDRSLSQTRSQRQGQFAANAVGIDRQNQQLAGQVLGQIASLQAEAFQGNENRALQALQLLSQIPQYADQRLKLALASLTPPTNPSSLLSNLDRSQQTGLAAQDRNSEFYRYIAQIAPQLIPVLFPNL